MFGIARDRDAPFKRAAADGEIAQAAARKGDDFVTASFRTDEIRMLLEELQQPVSESGKLEVVILFAHGFGRTAALRARRAGAYRVNIEFIEDAVLAAVGPFIDVAVFLHAPKNLLGAALVPVIGSANEIVISNSQAVKQLAELRGDLVNPFLGRSICGG